jgi:2-succinyl-6-hydroxy-2,4-cyclohexadiene-1-carboxylate synthase
MMVLQVLPTRVLLHGFSHTGCSWDPVRAALGERYRALAPDIRGHGAAAGKAPVTLDAVLADVAALGSRRFTLAGYSMGGRIALHVALAMPERVERMVLIGTSPGLSSTGERAARRAADERLAGALERSTIEEFAARWAQSPVLAGQPAAVAAAAHADRLRSTPAGLAAALRGLGTGALDSVWERLGRLGMPVTLVVGERDRKFTAIARRMAAEIREAEVEVVAGAGHAVHLEAPARVAELLSLVPGRQPVAEPGAGRDGEPPS